MGKVFESMTQQQMEFIEKQQMFFVATAATEGTVNLSPKGMDSLRIIDSNTIAWLNVTGSGNETSAHVQQNPRMTVMFCAFEGAPLILRLYGQARMLHQADGDWGKYKDLFPSLPGTRQIYLLDIDKTQSSCGMGVPLYDFVAQRDSLNRSHEKKGQKGVEAYWTKANQKSLDGFPTSIVELSGLTVEE
ncbi:pyridoxamine 5'-phosphate oxidase family protein [Parashewanella spongiae]|uniref:Pyridoxamine 5'-phosphate oxidase family protein n=1 Tax=Parashewanella spongiae TaxID=342950 RepID=A0A3A6U4G6_9GAMM|nr:pyridoxamine 5'-phosphate oxidase family protein [Parashewanella spongiae]MCL1078901.1 pyridoxamine 5'-phosphate oxidase family protein [Parashewanella spongiae]RJY19049.1 pyridoxamine 5'-phosphate oxidase family protein [Parashewanella spongiae]